MADYYTETSFLIMDRTQFIAKLEGMLHLASDDELDEPLNVDTMLANEQNDILAGESGAINAIRIFSVGDSFDVERLAEVIQQWMIEIDRDKPVTFTVSHSCSRNIAGAFTGDAICVTREKIHWGSHVWEMYLSSLGYDEESLGVAYDAG